MKQSLYRVSRKAGINVLPNNSISHKDNDVLSLNNSKFSGYQRKFEIKEISETITSSSHRCIPLKNKGKFYFRLYDKRDDFNLMLRILAAIFLLHQHTV